MDSPTTTNTANHVRHDSHHNFSVHAPPFQPRSSSPLKHHHQEASSSPSPSPSPSTSSNNTAIYHYNTSATRPPSAPISTHYTFQTPPSLPLPHLTTITRFSRATQKFTTPCLKCTEDNHYPASARTHRMVECSAVPEYHRAKLRQDREELQGEMLEILEEGCEGTVGAVLEVMGMLGAWAGVVVVGEAVGGGVRDEAIRILGRIEEGWYRGEEEKGGQEETEEEGEEDGEEEEDNSVLSCA